jgi:Fungal specific transcription factor domain
MVAQNRRCKPRTKYRAAAPESILTSREWLHGQQSEGGGTDYFRWWSTDVGSQQAFSPDVLISQIRADAASSPAWWSLARREDRGKQLTADSYTQQELFQPAQKSNPSVNHPEGGFRESGQSQRRSLGGQRSFDKEQNENFGLPEYIFPCQQRLSERTIKHLRDQGAFIMPEGHLRDLLVYTYVHFVYPQLPMIDIAEFATAITRTDESSKLSLLVLQAVFYSATDYVSMDALTASGFPSRWSARKTFFDRAKNLYDSGFEVDPIKVIQALLHMTSWTEGSPSSGGARALSAEAAGLARNASMLYPLRSPSMSVHDQRSWRRTWWCSVVQDRLMVLGHEPPSIEVHETSMQMLELADFEFSRPLPNIEQENDPFLLIRDEPKKEKLARTCIAMARLCMIDIDQSLQQGWKSDAEQLTALEGFRSSPDMATLIRGSKQLDTWASDFHQEIQHFMTDSTERCHDSKMVIVQQGILYSFYLALISILHRSLHDCPAPIAVTFGKVDEISFQKSRDAAHGITSIYQDILEMNLMDLLPHTVISILVEASTVHLLDASSGRQWVREVGVRQLRSSALALRCLSDLYSVAGRVYRAVSKALSRLDAEFPVKRTDLIPHEAEDTDEENQSQWLCVPPNPMHGEVGDTSHMGDWAKEEESVWMVPIRSTWRQGRDSCSTSLSDVSTPPARSSEEGSISHRGDVADQWQNLFDQLVDLGGIST